MSVVSQRSQRHWKKKQPLIRHRPSVLWGVVLCFAWLSGYAPYSFPWAVRAVWGQTPLPPHTAEEFMQAGQHAFVRGNLPEAVRLWQEAVRGYTSTSNAQGAVTALLSLGRAYETLGHYDDAERHFRMALAQAEALTEQAQTALSLISLGNLALSQGALASAERWLAQAQPLLQVRPTPHLTASFLHTRGNVFMAQRRLQDALGAYQESAQAAHQAQQPGMAARALAHAAVAAEQSTQLPMAETLLEEALTLLQQLPPAHETAYDLLFLARTYHRLASRNPTLVLRAAEVLYDTAQMATTLGDAQALAYAWGYLGQLYEEEQRYQEALELTTRAMAIAQRQSPPEVQAQWQWQTARLQRALHDLPAAMAAYDRAIALVQSVRGGLQHGQSREPVPFRHSLGPLYFEFVDLLLQQAAALEPLAQGEHATQYAHYLHQARVTVEAFKRAELQEYFGDECIDALRPSMVELERVSPEAAILYPILLPDRTEILLGLSTGLQRFTLPVPGAQLEQRVRVFLNALEARDPLRYFQHAQVLYRWLIQPFEADLAAHNIRTLVVVPDGALRLLPFAALYDGQQFLITKYAIAITPSVTLSEPKPFASEAVNVLAVGLSEAMAGFPPLPRVTEELQGIRALFPGTTLLDQAFSPERLDTTLRQGRFGVLHIAAHGQFAAEANESFLLTAQGKLTFTQLAQMLGRLRFREQPLELLTLSACETARGDDRAALGLAGLAIQAGARSALATLWLVEDEAAALLMEAFYRHLKHPPTSRAEALRQAQLLLLQHPQYHEPFFWAPFLLINNWL